MVSCVVTFVTVVFNGVEHLEQTILSVLALMESSNSSIEYVVIDGGSTDGTVEVIRKYERYLKYWISEPDQGIYDAMNKGWSAAMENSWLLFLGAGDQIKSLPDLSYYSDAQGIFGKVYAGDYLYTSSLSPAIEIGNTLHHQTLLLRKSVHPSPPFDIHYKICADYDFNLKLYKRKINFAFAEDLVSYAMPGGASSSSYAAIEMLDVVEHHFGIKKRLSAYWQYGLSVMVIDLRIKFSRMSVKLSKEIVQFLKPRE
jgi:glycosyltransferase involved in cell wall biosynthesis